MKLNEPEGTTQKERATVTVSAGEALQVIILQAPSKLLTPLESQQKNGPYYQKGGCQELFGGGGGGGRERANGNLLSLSVPPPPPPPTLGGGGGRGRKGESHRDRRGRRVTERERDIDEEGESQREIYR